MSNPSTTEPHSFEPIRLFLILGSGFFISWGPGLQKTVILNLYRLFPLFAGALVIYWVILGRDRFGAFPWTYNFFILFLLIHTGIVYLFLYPSEFTFKYTGILYTQSDYVLQAGTRGITVARIVLFIFFAYAFSSLMKSRREFTFFSFAYGLGYLSAILLGGHKTIDAIQGFARATGGFLNPNSMGMAGLLCCYLNLTVFLGDQAKSRMKVISLIFILIGIYGVLASVSRNTLAAFFCGGMVIIWYLPLIKKIRVMLLLVLFSFVAATTLLPVSILTTISKRITVQNVKETNWSMRREIWSDYILAADRYFYTGLGLGRSVEAVRDTYTFDSAKPLIPHQTYLQLLVEFGIIGLVLYIAAVWKLLKRGIQLSSSHAGGIQNAVMLGLLSAIIIYGIIGSILGERAVWLSLGAIAFVQTRLGENNQASFPHP